MLTGEPLNLDNYAHGGLWSGCVAMKVVEDGSLVLHVLPCAESLPFLCSAGRLWLVMVVVVLSIMTMVFVW